MKGQVSILRYRDISPRLNEFFPPPPFSLLRSRGEKGGCSLIPTNEELLTEDASFLRLWLIELLGEGKRGLSVEETKPETSSTSWGDFPSFSAIGKELQAVGDPLLHLDGPWRSEGELIGRVIEEFKGPVRALVGMADRTFSLLRKLKGKLGKRRAGEFPLEYAIVSGTPEISAIFAPLFRNLFPQTETREFYAAAEGVFAVQSAKRVGLSFRADRYSFQVETKRGLKPLEMLKRKEIGALIVTTPLLPNYRVGDLILALGEDRYRILGKEGSYPLASFYLHDISHEGGLP